jgi:hypothetical protein
MHCCEMNIEVGPSFLRYQANLSCTTSIGKQSCVKNKSVRNIDTHCVPVRLTASDYKRSSILNLLEQGFNRLIGVIRRVELCVSSVGAIIAKYVSK